MPATPKEKAQSLLSLTAPALAAQSATEFMAGVRMGFESLYRELAQHRTPKILLEALDEAFGQAGADTRQRKILELCAWPLFDKPALPVAPEEPPEFLWLFCLPFLVQFSLDDIKAPVVLEGAVVDGSAVLQQLAESGWLNDKSQPRTFPTVVSRADLQARGPRTLAALFVKAERGHDEILQPLPLYFDADIESGRVIPLYLLMAARLPRGEKQVLYPQSQWHAAESLAQSLTAGLRQQGLDVESVVSLPPCSLAETLFCCAGAGALALAATLDLAKTHYPLKHVLVRYPTEDMAELTAELDDGQEIALRPPFSFIEPRGEFQACLKRLCQERGVPFRGAFSAAFPSSSRHQ